jgi:hypothetical protein
MPLSLKMCAAGLAVAVGLTALDGCSASKSGGDGSPTSPSPLLTVKLRASDVLSGAGIPGATIAGSGVNTATTDAAGSLNLTTSSASTFAIDVTSPSYITRNTLLKVPGADVTISLIKNDFDLTAFNQMFRTATQNGTPIDGGLQRWTSAPSLRIISNVVQFRDGAANYTASSEALTPAEIQSITSDLVYGLPLLTGGVFQSFSGITTQAVAAGEEVTTLVEGKITFARCSGLTATRGSSGYGQWLFRNDDVVTGGMLCVDRDFELSGSSFGRGVRLHELGHALGANHVTAKDHVLMNPTISVNDVAAWDRDAAKIAFQRPAGNRTPDRDPSSFSTNSLTTRVMTVDGCRVRR